MTTNSKMRLLRPALWLLVALATGFVLWQIYSRASLSINANPLQRYKTGTLGALEILEKPPSIAPAQFLDKDNNPIALADVKAKIKIVNIWATWCPPCIHEMPSLGNLQERYGARGVKIVAISIDKDNGQDKARQKLKELVGGKLDFYGDPRMNLPFPLLVKGFPTSIIYDENNNEIARVSSTVDWNAPEVTDFMEAVLKN